MLKALDEDQCIDLLSTLRIINQVNQEQVWAICYQTATLMRHLTPSKCAPIESLAQIHLHRDGFVHEKTCSTSYHRRHHLRSGSSSTSPTSSSSPSSSPTPTATSTSITALSISGPATAKSAASTTTTTTTTTTTLRDLNYSCDVQDTHDQDLSDALSERLEMPNDSISQNNVGQQRDQQQQHLHHNLVLPMTPPITPELNDLLRRRPALDEFELVSSLGLALFWALDYGIPDDEERKLSIALEYLIFQSQNKLSLDKVIDLCTNRLPIDTKSHADSHYRGICKSLVSDTIELSIFLERIYNASMMLSDIALDEDLVELGEPLASLRALRINDWARLWMQVIRELRQRGNFKQPVAAI